MKVLYFTDDFSQKNQEFAKSRGLTIRNKHAYEQVDFLEQCDAVCGDVPQAYLDTYPVFDLPDEPKGEPAKPVVETTETTDKPDEQPKAKPKAGRAKKV